MKILIVDDDTVFATTLARGLSRSGHFAATAANGDETVAAVKEIEPDYVLLDLKLGSENGLALIKPILESHPPTKIILVTGYASIPTAVEAIKRGAADYLAKPIRLHQVLSLVDSVAQSEHLPSAGEAPSLRRLEWEHIQRTLADNDGNVSATARALGMHRRTLQRKLAKHPVKR